MSCHPSARLHAFLAVVALLAVISPGRSGEPATAEGAAEGKRTATADTIENARQELRKLKSEGAAAIPAPGGLPRLAAPEWHGGALSAPSAGPARPNPAAEPRNSNWLVDAMLKPGAEPDGERRRDRRGATGEHGTATASSARPVGRGVWDDSSEPRERTATAAQPPDASRVINPLASFLNEWMSPQDLALLKPGGAGVPVGPVAQSLSVAPFGSASGGMSASGAGSDGRMPPPGLLLPRGAGPARENPFLQGLTPPVPGVPPVAAPPQIVRSAPVAGPGTNSLTSPPPSAPPSRTPEFPRPASDDRYFKPLKRF